MQAAGPRISICPTFNPRANGNLTEIVAKVVDDCDSGGGGGRQLLCDVDKGGGRGLGSNFSFVTRDFKLSSTIPADEIIQNGKILPLYPGVAEKNSSLGGGNYVDHEYGIRSILDSAETTTKVRNPLKVCIEEAKTPTTASSSSPSSGNDRSGMPKETYHTVRAVTAEEEVRSSRRSGFAVYSSRRRKFKDILHKMHNGPAFAFLTHNSSERKDSEKKVKETPASSSRNSTRQR